MVLTRFTDINTSFFLLNNDTLMCIWIILPVLCKYLLITPDVMQRRLS